jgi:predicted transcriptional regulator
MEKKYKYNSITEFKKAHKEEYNILRNKGWLEKFQKEMGWEYKFHRNDGYWDVKENVLQEALKYKIKSHWVGKSNASYKHAVKHGWYEECITHMVAPQKSAGYWNNKEHCIESAKQFKTIKKWSTAHYGAWENAKKNGWFDECTAHMISNKFPAGYWNNKERCIESAKQFKTIKDWSRTNYGAWENAKKNGWFDECTAHMISNRLPDFYWTLELCKQDALKYKTKIEWSKSSKAYKSALNNKWIEECTSHMIAQKIPQSYWTKELCIAEALKYDKIYIWSRNNSSSYKAARTNGWYEECIRHMKKTKPNGYWDVKENCIEEALKHNGLTKWIKASSSSHKSAKKNGWFDECSAHMKK